MKKMNKVLRKYIEEEKKGTRFYRCPDVEVADKGGKGGSKWKGWGPIIWFVKSRDVSASRIRVSDSRPVECGPVSNQTPVAVADAVGSFLGRLGRSTFQVSRRGFCVTTAHKTRYHYYGRAQLDSLSALR